MKLKIFLFFGLLIFKLTSSEEIVATFHNFSSHFNICDLYIDNENGFDLFEDIKSEQFYLITQLHISGLSLNFPQIICSNFIELQKIFASELNLENISLNSFEKCDKLLHLDLQSNKISNIPEDAFENNSQLEILNLKLNQLSNIPDGLFKPLKALRELILDENPILNFPPGISNTIEKISLHSCSLDGTWKSEFLNHAHNLKYVDIGNNTIKEIERNSFNSSEIFAFLADENKIEILDAMTFGGHEFKYLIMNGNKLKAIDGIFQHWKGLKYFGLSDNDCVTENSIDQGCLEGFHNRTLAFTLNKDSKPFFSSVYYDSLRFSLKSTSDVILRFSDTLKDPQTTFTVRFGAKNNSMTIFYVNDLAFSNTTHARYLLNTTNAKNYAVLWDGEFRVSVEVSGDYRPWQVGTTTPKLNFYEFSTESELADIALIRLD